MVGDNRDMPLSQAVIMEKARSLFEELQKQNSEEPCTSSAVETFAASRGYIYFDFKYLHFLIFKII